MARWRDASTARRPVRFKSRRWVLFAGDAYRRYQQLNGSMLTGLIAYRMFMLVVPVAVASIAIAGYLNDVGQDPGFHAGTTLGLGTAVADLLRTAGQDSHEHWTTGALVAGCGMLLGGYGLLSGLHRSFTQIWELPPARPRRWLSAAGEVAAGFLVLIVVILAAHGLHSSGLAQLGVAVLVTFVAVFASLLGLSLMLPNRAAVWSDLIPGAVAGSVLFTVIHEITIYVLPRRVGELSGTYGTLGVAIAALLYLYMVGFLVLVSGFVNATWSATKRNPNHLQPPSDEGRPI